MVRTGQLVRCPGQVFIIAGSVPSLRQQTACAAFAAARHVRVTGGAVGGASHRAAARLLGMRTVDADIDVSVRYPRRLSLPDARVVRSRDLLVGDVTWVDGIPSTTPERTIVDLGMDFPVKEVTRILRHAVSTGLVIRREVRRMRLRTSKQGRDGTGVAEICLELVHELAEETESGTEALFLQVCKDHDLTLPVIQLPVIANGRSYRLDFAYPAERVFIEIDGAPHDDPVRIAKDGGRQNDLVAHGWKPIRLHYDQLVHNPASCIATIRTALGVSQDL